MKYYYRLVQFLADSMDFWFDFILPVLVWAGTVLALIIIYGAIMGER